MLPMLAGIAGLALFGNPLKRMFKSKAKRKSRKARRNPVGKVAAVKRAARLWLSGKYGKMGAMEDALDEAGAPISSWARERMQDEIDDIAEHKRRAGVNPKRRAKRNPFAKGPILKGAELPKGARKGSVFHLAGVKYLVMSHRIRRGKRIVRQRIARPVTGVHRI